MKNSSGKKRLGSCERERKRKVWRHASLHCDRDLLVGSFVDSDTEELAIDRCG